MLKKLTPYLLGIILLPYLVGLAYGQTTVFGPEVYTRDTGKPQKIVKSFSVKSPVPPFTLVVNNGEGKRGRVTSAVIEINGVQVLGPEEFNKQIDEITVPVKLEKQNEIAVEIRGEPGTFLTVTIFRDSRYEILASAFDDYVDINQSTSVTFSALIEKPYPNLNINSVNLIQYDEKYKHIADLGTLYNDGTHGDYKAGDNSFRTQIVINKSSPGILYYRISVIYKDNETFKKVLSDLFSVKVAKIPSVTGTISPARTS